MADLYKARSAMTPRERRPGRTSEGAALTSIERSRDARSRGTPAGAPRTRPRPPEAARARRGRPASLRRGPGCGEKSPGRVDGGGCAPRRRPPAGAPRCRFGRSRSSIARRLGGGAPRGGRRTRSTLRIPFVFEGGRRERTSPGRPDPSSHCEFLASLAAARRQDGAARPRPHAHEKAVRALALAIVGLIGALHEKRES